MMQRRERLVYIPGIDGTGRLLFRQPRLHSTYDLHCVSYPQNTTHTYDDLVELAAHPLRQAGGGIVLAESFGGGVALTLALRYPALVRRMMLVNTFGWFPRRVYIELLARLGPYFPDRPGHPATQRLRERFFFSQDVSADVRRHWWQITADVPLSAYGRRFVLIRGLDLRSVLDRVQPPTLVLAAPDDRVVPGSAGVFLAKHIPKAKVIRYRVGHAAMVHPAVDIADLLARWVFDSDSR